MNENWTNQKTQLHHLRQPQWWAYSKVSKLTGRLCNTVEEWEITRKNVWSVRRKVKQVALAWSHLRNNVRYARHCCDRKTLTQGFLTGRSVSLGCTNTSSVRKGDLERRDVRCVCSLGMEIRLEHERLLSIIWPRRKSKSD